MFNPYVKAVLAMLAAFVGGLATGIDDGRLTNTEIVTAAGLAIAAGGFVWAAHKTIKWIVGGVSVGLASLAVALQDNKLSWQEGITIGSAVLVALYAVYQTSNTPASNNP